MSDAPLECAQMVGDVAAQAIEAAWRRLRAYRITCVSKDLRRLILVVCGVFVDERQWEHSMIFIAGHRIK